MLERDVVAAALPAVRSVLDVRDLPPDGRVRALPELRRAVAGLVRLRLRSNYRMLVGAVTPLLAELHRAFAVEAGQRREAVAGLLVQAYRAADAVADKFGYYDLSARIIDLMRAAAAASGDELAVAAAAYVRAETFLCNGHLSAGRRMLELAAHRLLPGADVAATAAYGALHMRAAVLAARAGRPVAARDHLAEARACATRVPEGVYHGTVFGPASVHIHHIALTVDAGDPHAALRLADRWQPPARLPAERHSHLYIEIARAAARIGAPERALDAVDTARRIAPEHVRDHPQVHQILDQLAMQAAESTDPYAPQDGRPEQTPPPPRQARLAGRSGDRLAALRVWTGLAGTVRPVQAGPGPATPPGSRSPTPRST